MRPGPVSCRFERYIHPVRDVGGSVMLDRLIAKYSEPERRARLVWWLWVISSAFTLFGFAVILYLVLA